MKKMLIVDDDPMILEVLQRYLSKIQVKIETASNGAKALKLIKENQYDLLLTDCIMGEMNGFELVKQVQDHYPNLFIMVMSSESFRETFKKAGINYFFSKPLNLLDIGDTINKILKIK